MVTDASTAESRMAKKRLRKERGQSLIEFALTAPMLIVLLLGLVEMGHAFNSYMTVVAAARDSARLGAQLGVTSPSSLPTMRNLVVKETERLENAPIPTTPVTTSGSQSGNNCGTSDPGVCIKWGNNAVSGSGQPIDKWVNVRVCYNHSMIVGIPGVIKDDLNLCSSTQIRIANPGS
jgi:TadE-like protein